VLDLLRRVLRHAKRAIIAAGSLATSIAAVIALVAALSDHKPTPTPTQTSPPPPSPETKILPPTIRPEIFLGEYTVLNQSAAGNVSFRSPSQRAGYQLAVYTESESSQGAIHLTVAGSPSGISTTAGAEGATATGGEATAPERTQPEIQEVKKATESSETAVAQETASQEQASKSRQETLAHIEAPQAKAAVAERLKKDEAALQERDQALTRTREAAKISKEETEESAREKRVSSQNGTRPKTRPQAPLIKPPPSATPFHREGDARVLAGTGAPTGEVDTVLGKVAAILGAGASAGRRNAAFTPRTATIDVPSHCNVTCGLQPTIDQAIADSSPNLAEAARVVAAAITGSRSANFEHRHELVGVEVHYRLDAVHLAGKRLVVEWTLYSQTKRHPAPRAWWRSVIVKQIMPRSNNAKVKGQFWAPIPPASGNYYIVLKVLEAGEPGPEAETDIFH